MQEKRLILTQSYKRSHNFLDLTAPFMRLYAAHCKADFVIVTENSPLFSLLSVKGIKVGRPNNGEAYIMKMLAVGHFLEAYDKVLWLDDTCIVKDTTPDIFEQLSDAYDIAAYAEGKKLDVMAARRDKEFLQRHVAFDMDTRQYINSGVVVYSQRCKPFLNANFITGWSRLFMSSYADQGYINFVIQNYKLRLLDLDEKFNSMFLVNGYTEDERNLCTERLAKEHVCTDAKQIIHLTGFYKNRFELLEAVSSILSA